MCHTPPSTLSRDRKGAALLALPHHQMSAAKAPERCKPLTNTNTARAVSDWLARGRRGGVASALNTEDAGAGVSIAAAVAGRGEVHCGIPICPRGLVQEWVPVPPTDPLLLQLQLSVKRQSGGFANDHEVIKPGASAGNAKGTRTNAQRARKRGAPQDPSSFFVNEQQKQMESSFPR